MLAKCLVRTLGKVVNQKFPLCSMQQHVGFSYRSFSVSGQTFSGSVERRYSEKHEWVSVEGAIGTIGISHFAQQSLGDIVFAQLPDLDTNLEANEECGALESVKAASELYSPVSGKVTETNALLESEPGLINKSPLDKGRLDPGEDAWTAAVRETEEESGLSLRDLKVHEDFQHVMRYRAWGRDKTVVYWLAELTNPQAQVRLSSEHSAMEWCTPDRLRQLCDTFPDQVTMYEEAIKFLKSNKHL